MVALGISQLFKILCLFLSPLGLSCGKQQLLSRCAVLLVAVASLVAEHGL